MSKITKFKNLLKNGKSIEFKIVTSCLFIIISFAVLVSIITINNFSNYVNNNADNKTSEISQQITYNFDNYINGIIETFDLVIESLENTTVSKNSNELKRKFNDVLKYRNDISNITLFSIDGESLVNTANFYYAPGDVKQMFWFYEAIEQPSIHYFSSPYTTEDGYSRIFVTKFVKYNYGEGQGVLLMEINSDNIINLSKNANLGANGQIIIINDSYRIVFSTNENVSNKVLDSLKDIVLGSETIKLDSNKMSVNISTLNNTRWRIAVIINVDETASAQNKFALTLIAISLIVLLATTFVVSLLSKNIANPLKKLESTMKEIEEADYLLVEEVNIGKQKEIASLSESFNLMMKRIKELMDKVVLEQESQRKSELKALQNQINPHFLYNTLDNIVWLIDNKKNKEASEMVVALAKLFRISISRGRNIITVKDELEHAKSYLFIQSIRYANAFKYEFDVDPEVVEFTTMKLILQPLIENAIYHGLKNRIDEGELKISAKLINNKVVFKVQDNGYGMKNERIEEIYTRFRNPDLNDGVGLKNVYLRLKIFYGDEADLLIDSELDEGTVITIIIPQKVN